MKATVVMRISVACEAVVRVILLLALVATIDVNEVYDICPGLLVKSGNSLLYRNLSLL